MLPIERVRDAARARIEPAPRRRAPAERPSTGDTPDGKKPMSRLQQLSPAWRKPPINNPSAGSVQKILLNHRDEAALFWPRRSSPGRTLPQPTWRVYPNPRERAH
mmetsp:Transcript_22535/g.57973  ORF Transcript_22535/g.57973 Transcript_22535/m.57973 type:complete len:105 (+) Transcript_22535:671-985(+)